MATPLDTARELIQAEGGLAVVVTLRRDGTPQTSVVNVGVLDDPATGEPAVGLVVRGGTAKLANLRRQPHAAVVLRSGGRWLSIEGPARIVGPDEADPPEPGALAALLRQVFQAAGGTHDDWDTYDRVMRDERRAAVLVAPVRFTTNGGRPR